MPLSLCAVKKIYTGGVTVVGTSMAAIDATMVAYEGRAALRSLTGSSSGGNLVFVESLGLFKYYPTSTELDDDETCFVNSASGGRWIVECPHWDLIDASMIMDELTQDERIEDLEGKLLTSTVSNTITSVATLTQTSLSASVTGASIGDTAIVTPDTNLDARISLYARVSAANTVTVIINNASASAATLTAGTWRVTVIKP